MLERNELGVVKISRQVIAGIASRSAREIKGVQGIGGGFLNRMGHIFGIDSFQSVKSEILTNGEVIVSIPIIIEYGKEVSSMAQEVQEKIRKDIEELTGLEVARVDVRVEEVK
ncbi:hypothetical protein AUJ66_06025 [Candidatus Desantisbacteria bacterium CG1_02_38_46]|uniref:Alkaline-shock protein n=1 Tax=Candidatus Desantisbacteria bacterium CG1_02_38_46 TaxID=1817893 RepID=A0A1J4SAP1_9BACT|nr:MAG: hypothetical protein AUJ66_06025 [Candidatus Desantisbacteria bacterium CG1_02_38_46]